MSYRPRIATPENASISRDGERAIVRFNDNKAAGAIYLEIGEAINSMDDLEILELHNDVVRAQLKSAAIWRPFEVSDGYPQIKFDKEVAAYVAEGHVLRCLIEAGSQLGQSSQYRQPKIVIDKHELTLAEFGELLSQFEGWGMRVTFVPEDRLTNPPAPVKRKGKRVSKRSP